MFADPEFSAPGNSFLWGLVLWKVRNASALGFSSCRSTHMNGAWISSSTKQTWRLVPVTQLLIYLSFFICTLPISRAPTASPAASKLGIDAWNVEPRSMSVDNAAEDSPSLQLPDVPVPLLWEKHWVQSVSHGSPLWCTSLVGLVHAFNMERLPFHTLRGHQ